MQLFRVFLCLERQGIIGYSQAISTRKQKYFRVNCKMKLKTILEHLALRLILRTHMLSLKCPVTNVPTGSCAAFFPKKINKPRFCGADSHVRCRNQRCLQKTSIILQMNSLRRTSAESMRLLVSNLYSDRCSICYCNS